MPTCQTYSGNPKFKNFIIVIFQHSVLSLMLYNLKGWWVLLITHPHTRYMYNMYCCFRSFIPSWIQAKDCVISSYHHWNFNVLLESVIIWASMIEVETSQILLSPSGILNSSVVRSRFHLHFHQGIQSIKDVDWFCSFFTCKGLFSVPYGDLLEF